MYSSFVAQRAPSAFLIQLLTSRGFSLYIMNQADNPSRKQAQGEARHTPTLFMSEVSLTIDFNTTCS